MSSSYLIYDNRHTLSLSSHPFQITLAFFNRRFFGESGCKDTTIFQTAKIFFQKNLIYQYNLSIYQHYPSRKKFHYTRKTALQNLPHTLENTQKSPRCRKNRQKTAFNSTKSLYIRYITDGTHALIVKVINNHTLSPRPLCVPTPAFQRLFYHCLTV